jgi:hypothetical protein
MLRWADRLKHALRRGGVAGIDFPIGEDDPDCDCEDVDKFREIREAEFISPGELPAPRSTRSTKRLKAGDSNDILAAASGSSDITSEFPPELRWDDLGRWLYYIDFTFPLQPTHFGERDRGPETRPCPFATNCIDIFWLSPDEFISLSEIVPNCHHYTLEIGPMARPIYAYNRATYESFSYEEESPKGPTPMAAFRFIRHLFALLEKKISLCACTFNACHVESITPAIYTEFLSIVSSFDCDRFVTFKLSGNLFRDPLQELTMIQFHPSARLEIEPNEEFELGVTDKELMDIVRDCHHLSHWPVGNFPYLVANSLVESLHFSRHNNWPGWSESVAELSQNQIVKKLSIEFTNSKSLDDIAALVNSVFACHKSLEHLCMTTQLNSGQDESFVDMFAGKISSTLSTVSSHGGSGLHVGLSYFGLTCIGRKSKARRVRHPRYWKVKCNDYWDTMISPWLVYNWLHRKPDKPPLCKIPALLSTGLVGVATQAVNQGLAYAETSNLVPHDVSTSSATVLFCLLRRNFASLAEVWDTNALSQ